MSLLPVVDVNGVLLAAATPLLAFLSMRSALFSPVQCNTGIIPIRNQLKPKHSEKTVFRPSAAALMGAAATYMWHTCVGVQTAVRDGSVDR